MLIFCFSINKRSQPDIIINIYQHFKSSFLKYKEFNQMIHEASVKFFNKECLLFDRQESNRDIDLEQEHKFEVLVDRNKLIFMEEDYAVCKLYTSPYVWQQRKGKLYLLELGREGKKTQVLMVQGHHSFYEQIKDTVSSSKKYKNCLSYIPSKVKHISILSGESPIQKFRGFINLIGIMFVVLNLRNIIDNFVKYGVQFHRAPSDFVALHSILATFGLLIFPVIIHLIEKAKFLQLLNIKTCIFLEYSTIMSIMAYNIAYCHNYQPTFIIGTLFTALSIVCWMKLISYVQVNSELFEILQKIKEQKGLPQKKMVEKMFSTYEISEGNLQLILQHKAHWSSIVNYRKLIYFLFAPTLCYQLQYPHTSSIRYTWLAKRFIEFLIFIGFMIIIWFQYIEPELDTALEMVISKNYTWIDLLYQQMRVSIPNTVLWIAGFYTFFHLWLNMLSQLLYFGDRKFYLDWWNSRTLQEYWKTWNLPVHFWFIRHCYYPVLRKGISKPVANILVFLISAIAHQYLVSVPLGLISYWAFLAMLIQAPAIIIQNKFNKIFNLKDSELGNVSFWISLCMVGQPIVVFIYYSLFKKKMQDQLSLIVL